MRSGLTFSPEAAPPNTSGTIPPTPPPPFNLNTISQGISTSDFYLTVPTAFLRFLETDSRTKQLAKPQLRGAEGTGADAQPRRPDSGRLDGLRRRGRWRVREHPAVVVHLPRRRRQHHDDAARDLRGRDHHRPHRGEQQPRTEHQRRRTGRPVVRIAPGEDAAAAARGRVQPARRPPQGRSAQGHLGHDRA